MGNERIFLGLHAGVAADGIDAVAMSICGEGELMTVDQIEYVGKYYPEGERQRILQAMGGRTGSCSLLAELDRDIAIAAAATGNLLLSKSEITVGNIEAAGWSGQELAFVNPGSTNPLGSCLYAGSPEIIADRMGCPVISRFGECDLAVGGNGGSLNVWCDWLMFRDMKLSRVIVDIGGSVTITFVPQMAELVDLESYDVAPGTLVLDGLVQRVHSRNCDVDGSIAGKGRVHPVMLNELLSNGYFLQEPPKRLNVANWLDSYQTRLAQMAKKHRVTDADLITTVAEMIACAIADGISSLTEIPHEVILAGGGALNIYLADRITKLLDPSRVCTIEKCGLNIRTHRAACMAVLAAVKTDGLSAHCPGVTGASHKVVLGTVFNPR